MFKHEKPLFHPVEIDCPNPQYAVLLQEQLGGANGELKAALQYMSQSFRIKDPEIKDLFLDIAAEELGHLEMVSQTINLLNGHDVDANTVNDGEIQTHVLLGLNPGLINASGYSWTADYVSVTGDLCADLLSNIASEQRAKVVYEYLYRQINDKKVRETIVMRLRSAAKTVGDVSHSLNAVSETLRQSELPDATGVYDKVRENVCRSCGLRETCWEQSHNETLNVFNDAFSVLKSGQTLSEKKLPQYFLARCIRLPSLIECFSSNYKAYLMRLSAETRIDEIRAVSAEQFSGISDLLYDLSDEFDEKTSFDLLAAQRVRTVLSDMEINAVDVCCTIDKYDRMKLEIHCENPKAPVNRTRLLEKLETACERPFEIPDIINFDGLVHITAVQRAPLRTVIGAAQFCAGEEKFCGDAYECFSDSHGRYYIIVSDGMGTGVKAAVGAAMASGIAARLIEAGFHAEGALKMVNSALITKSRDESSATLDIVCIDLFGGHVDFFKAGAPSTLVKRRGKVVSIECASLPAGILRNTEFSRASGCVSAGDMILIATDGVTDEDKEEIRRRMKLFKGGEVSAFARELASFVKEKHRSEPHDDDVTVVIAGIAANN